MARARKGAPRGALLLGTRKGLLTLVRGRGRWRVVGQEFLGIAVAYARVDERDGTGWACLDHGHWGQKLHRLRGDARRWEEVPAPRYPADTRGTDGRPATLRYLWTIAPGGEDRPGRLYAGTVPGGLFRSEDGGESFELVRGLWDHPSRAGQWLGGGKDFEHPGLHSVVVDPRASDHVWVGVSCAGVFETTDGGATWAPRNRGLVATFLPDPRAEVGHDPHCLVQSRARADRLWQQNHCGIFRSDDGGGRWRRCSRPGALPHFGFAMAVDPEDADTAWVVPALADDRRVAVDGALCVCRTRDAGRTWKALRRGLPQADCYDVVLRHGLDHDRGRLAFGTTTGHCFVSEDRGDSWTCAGHHLPPIHSVRFAGC
ncbi:MAG: glycosyl hydrolase [Planctomycetes bacterium]|nr:glycosyl hydrolase [Planctomycetota bacterium]